jgi:hypothetical protein
MHWEGDPDYCSEWCSRTTPEGVHFDDEAPEVCEECGGNGLNCYRTGSCVERLYVTDEPNHVETGDEYYEYG